MPGFFSSLFGGSTPSTPGKQPNGSLPVHYSDRMPGEQRDHHRRSTSSSGAFSFPPAPNSATGQYSSSQQIPPSPSATPAPTFGEQGTSSPLSANYLLKPTHASASHSVYSSSSGQHLTSYPPLKQTFRRLRELLAPVYPELLDTLSYPLPERQIIQFQQNLHDSRGDTVRLPRDVKEYLSCHDGQDVFSIPSLSLASGASGMGLVFGLWLMTSEEILEEWDAWRRMEARRRRGQEAVDDPFNFISRDQEKSYLKSRMHSCPAGWVKAEYSIPGWIPLMKDGMGNYIGVDLDPPLELPPSPSASTSSRPSSPRPSSNQWTNVAARPGQVIAFGRDVDTKTVLFPGWGSDGGFARFLSSFVDDLESGEFASFGDLELSLTSMAQASIPRRPSAPSTAIVRDGQPQQDWQDEPVYASPHIAAAVRQAEGYQDSEDGDSDQEYSREDGIGDIGYFEQGADSYAGTFTSSTSPPSSGLSNHHRSRSLHLTGPNGSRAREERTRGTSWWLKSPYKGMGVIEALCLRAQRRWQEVDLYSSDPSAQLAKRKKTRGQSNDGRPISSGSRVLFQIPSPVPNATPTFVAQPPDDEEQAQDPSNEHLISEQEDVILPPLSPSMQDSLGTPLSVTLSPPSPKKLDRFPNNSLSSSQSSSRKGKEREWSESPDDSHSQRLSQPRSDRRQSLNNVNSTPTPAARRKPPPPVAVLDLPTLANLDLEPVETKEGMV